MKSIPLLAVTLLVISCDREVASDQAQASKVEAQQYPEKVTALLKLIEQLEPGTKENDWLQLVDRTIGLPDEDVILDGGAGMGESWLTIGIGAGDEWALSIESYQGSEFIWEAKVVRTSVSKALADERHEDEVIYPHYYQGHLVSTEEEKIQIRKQVTEEFYRKNKKQ